MPTTAVTNVIMSTLDALSAHKESMCIHDTQTLMYHLGNVCFLISYLSPNIRYGQVCKISCLN